MSDRAVIQIQAKEEAMLSRGVRSRPLTTPRPPLPGAVTARARTCSCEYRSIFEGLRSLRVTALRIRLYPRYEQDRMQKHAFLSLQLLDPGCGRKILAIWHGAGVKSDVFISEY